MLTSQFAIALLPSAVAVAAIVALPGITAVISPLVGFTVAIAVSLEFHVTCAFAGATFAVSVSFPVGSISIVCSAGKVIVTFSDGCPAGFTVTAHVAVWLPSCVVTFTSAVPAFFGFTVQILSVGEISITPASLGSTTDQVTFWLAAFVGSTVAVNVPFAPFDDSVSVPLSNLTPVTAPDVLGVTVTVHSALTVAPFAPTATAVIVAVPFPAATAVTLPLWSTVAAAGLLLLHVTVLSVALSGLTVAVSFFVSSSSSDMLGVIATLSTGTFAPSAVTLTVQVAVKPVSPSAGLDGIAVSVIVTPSPTFFASRYVLVPLVSSFRLGSTILGSLELQCSDENDALSGTSIAASWVIFVPTFTFRLPTIGPFSLTPIFTPVNGLFPVEAVTMTSQDGAAIVLPSLSDIVAVTVVFPSCDADILFFVLSVVLVSSTKVTTFASPETLHSILYHTG